MPGISDTASSPQWWAEGWPRALPFGLYIGCLALVPSLSDQVADLRWLYAGQVGVAALALAWYWRRYEELRSVSAMGLMEVVLAAGIGLAVFVAWIHLDVPWLARAGGGGFNPTNPDGSLDLVLIVLRIGGAAVVIPIMEELFWRSFLLRWVDQSDFTRMAPRAVSTRALVYCAIAFGLEHNLWFAGILAGLAYGWLYRHTGTLWAPVSAHSLTNLLLGLWIVKTGNWQFW